MISFPLALMTVRIISEELGERSSRDSSGERISSFAPPVKSAKEGPALSLSVKLVGERLVIPAPGVAVARPRVWRRKVRTVVVAGGMVVGGLLNSTVADGRVSLSRS